MIKNCIGSDTKHVEKIQQQFQYWHFLLLKLTNRRFPAAGFGFLTAKCNEDSPQLVARTVTAGS